MSQGPLGSSNLDASFFGRLQEGGYNQAGRRSLGFSPEQGTQFNAISRDQSRSMYNGLTRPRSWKSVLGLQPSVESDFRFDSGQSSTPGSVRARAGRTGGELNAPEGLTGEWSFKGTDKDGTTWGVNEKNYQWNYDNNKDDSDNFTWDNVSRAATSGIRAMDQGSSAVSQSGFNKSQDVDFKKEGSEEWENLGQGGFTDQGKFRADLRSPTSQVSFNNNVNSQLAGRATASSTTSNTGGSGSSGRTSEDMSSLGPTVGMGISMLNPLNFVPGASQILGEYDPINLLAGAAARFLGSGKQVRTRNTNIDVGTGQQSNANARIDGGGELNFDRNTNTSAEGAAEGMYAGLGVRSDSSSGQRFNTRTGEDASASVNLRNNVGGVASARANEEEILRKKMFKWNPEKPEYTMDSSFNTTEQVGLGNESVLDSNKKLTKDAVPADWADNNIDKNIINNFDSLKQRFPSLYGQYPDVNEFITREYYRQNPQNRITTEQTAQVNNQGQVVSGIDPNSTRTKNANQNVSAKGDITLSGQGQAAITSGADITTRSQDGQYVLGWAGGRQPVSPSSTIDLKLKSNLEANLGGGAAEASAVNDLKFKFNNTQYGATLKLEAQRFINDLETQLPRTADSERMISALRDNPELTSLFNSNVAPNTAIKAILDYDNETKRFKTSLDSTVTNDNYRAAQIYDPTPWDTTNNDEIALANVLGDVRQLDRGRLYDLGITDNINYSTLYSLPTPITNQSNEYLADDKTYNQQLQNNLYYYANGGNEMYDSLANEFIDRKYNRRDNFDTTKSDVFLSQINELIANNQGLDKYSVQDLQKLSNLLKQERDIDARSVAPNVTTSGDSYFLPDTQVIDPTFGNNVVGGRASHFQDPRSKNPSQANLLDKYYDYSAMPYDARFFYDWKYGGGGFSKGTPGGWTNGGPMDPGRGALRHDMLGARELTPEEFAQAQILGQAKLDGKDMNALIGNKERRAANYVPISNNRIAVTEYMGPIYYSTPLNPYQIMSTPGGMTNHQYAKQLNDQYSRDAANFVAAKSMPINAGGPNKYTNPDLYAKYVNAMNQQVQSYLAANPNRPV